MIIINARKATTITDTDISTPGCSTLSMLRVFRAYTSAGYRGNLRFPTVPAACLLGYRDSHFKVGT